MASAEKVRKYGCDDDTELGAELREMVLHPRRCLIPAWSWQAAVSSALFRAGVFYVTNLRAGRAAAIRAGVVEVVFAVVAAGLLGAVSQRLRLARPLWATVVLVWLAFPAIMLLAQFGVHQVAHTRYMGTGLLASFALSAIASSFSWYAMRHGALLGGDVSTTMMHDVRHLPNIVWGYMLAGPRALLRRRS
jgi:MFS-type transporter involved in bile tolerance (Atg22 family)